MCFVKERISITATDANIDLARAGTHWNGLRRSRRAQTEGPRVTAAAGPQSNFPACRSVRRIDKSHSWLLCGGKWSLYCFSKTNVGSRRDRSYFQSQRKTTQTQTHTHTRLTRPPTLLNWKTAFPPFHFSLPLHSKTHSFPLSSPSLSPPFSPLFFPGLLHFFQGGNFNNTSTIESIESCRAIPQKKFPEKAHFLFLMPWTAK